MCTHTQILDIYMWYKYFVHFTWGRVNRQFTTIQTLLHSTISNHCWSAFTQQSRRIANMNMINWQYNIFLGLKYVFISNYELDSDHFGQQQKI